MRLPLGVAALLVGVALLVLVMKKPSGVPSSTLNGPGWLYKQSTGELFYLGALIARGYSGAGAGKDNPAMQDAVNLGPIPQGTYAIGAPSNSAHVGPFALALDPVDADTFGRDAFFIHGDSLEHPGQASHGCIVLPRAVREQIAGSGDTLLTVIA